jgi:hypothetical protein
MLRIAIDIIGIFVANLGGLGPIGEPHATMVAGF